jgi:hypothetical protein
MPYIRVALNVLFLLLTFGASVPQMVGGMKQTSAEVEATSEGENDEPAAAGSPSSPPSPSLSSSLKTKEKKMNKTKKEVHFADPPLLQQPRDKRPKILMMADAMVHSHYTLMVFFVCYSSSFIFSWKTPMAIIYRKFSKIRTCQYFFQLSFLEKIVEQKC